MSDVFGRISLPELKVRLRDFRIPDRDLARFLIGDAAQSRPFAPALMVDPQQVAMTETEAFGTRGSEFLKIMNGIARQRRRDRFLAAPPGDARPVIVAEGDSWLQFPILLDDIVDQLQDRFRIWCLAAGGDTLRAMVLDAPEFITEQQRPEATRAGTLLFSGTGNDFLGERDDGRSVLSDIVRPFTAGLPVAAYIETPGFRLARDFVRETLAILLTRMQEAFPGRRTVLVGYDYVRPHEGETDPRRDKLHARRDQYLTAPLQELGIQDPTLRRRIIAAMVDQLHAVLAELCGGNHPSGRFPFAWHADLRNTLPDLHDWTDEIHPTNDGFRRVAARVAPLLV